MANLIVTFTRARDRGRDLQVAVGSAARTEEIEIAAVSTDGPVLGSLSCAASSEDTVELYAAADCWIAIGAAPEAEAGSGRFMKTGAIRELFVAPGDKVSVVAA